MHFQSHVDNVVNRARRLAGLMFHSFQSRSKFVILPIFLTLIRPTLEYASVIWNPYKIKQIKKLEAVQRYVTKRLYGYSQLSYDERLNSLKLPKLSARRQYFDLVEVYKIIHGISFVGKISYTFLNRRTRGHQWRIKPMKFTRNVRKTALLIRAANSWNLLPASVAEATSLSQFKTRLRHYLSFPK